MGKFTLNTTELAHRASLLKQNGQTLRNLSGRLSLQANLNTGLALDFQRITRVRSAASKLRQTGTRLINLGTALERIVNSSLNQDVIDEQYIIRTLSKVDAVESQACMVCDGSTTSGGGNYWSRSLDYAVKGDYSNGFTLMGMFGNIGIGLIPFVGQAADVRDFSYAVSHTSEHSFWGNVGLISLSVVAFIPIVGDAAKNLKYLKYADEVGDVVKQVDKVDDVTKGLAKNGDEFVYGVSDTFRGTLKGVEIEIPNVKMENINYIKRSTEETKTLRYDFNSTVKKGFLGELRKMDDASLQKAGLSADDILQIRVGQIPDGFQIHHKLPLDDSGDNSLSNLVLIKNDPYHKVITNYQNEVTRNLGLGDSLNVSWPIPNSMIYTGK